MLNLEEYLSKTGCDLSHLANREHELQSEVLEIVATLVEKVVALESRVSELERTEEEEGWKAMGDDL